MERHPRSRQAAALAAGLLLATLAAGLLGIAITDKTNAVALWWPAAGTGLLTLLLLPRRWWPALTGALALVYVAANLIGGRPFGASVCLGASDLAETVLVATAINRTIGRQMRSVGDFGRLFLFSLGGAFLAALGIATTAATLLDGTFGDNLLATTSSHWTSVILLAPLGLIPRERIVVPRLVLCLQTLLLLGATLLAFGPDQELSLGFAPIPFLILAGLFFGYRVVAVQQVGISVVVTTLTLADWGPFANEQAASSQVVQLYLVSLVLSGLPLALAVQGQRDATRFARSEKQRTEAVIDSSRTPILVTDSNGILLSVNPATTQLTGFSAAELLGRPFWERLLPQRRWEASQELFRNPDRFPEHGEGVILTTTGSERLVTYSTGVLRNPDESLNFVFTATDITSERATSHLLEHLLRSATTVAILGTDRSGAITVVNAGAEAMLHLDGDEASRHHFLDFLDPDEVAARAAENGTEGGFAALVHAVAEDGSSQTQDWTWVAPGGSPPIRVSMTTSLVADENRRPIGYLFVARDVTENRRNQELLQKALQREETAVHHLRALDLAKDDFISTVSHELRTPLTSIVGSTELLSDGLAGELSTQQRQMIEVIDRNAERLLSLANDLLLLAAQETPSVADQFEPLDLREVITSSHATVMPLLAHRRLDLRPLVPDEPVMVSGDATYLERAVTNLLTNAIKFTPDGGSIRIQAGIAEDGGSCYLAVSDTGIGIPADELENVFVRFFRSSNVQPQAIQGTGLGLAIVHSIVESHHGQIDVESEPGVGTTFTITLPRL